MLIDLIQKGYFAAGTSIVFWHTGGTPALFADHYRSLIWRLVQLISPWVLFFQPEGLPSGFPGQPLAIGDFNPDGHIALFSAAAKAVMRWEALKMVHLADALYGLV